MNVEELPARIEAALAELLADPVTAPSVEGLVRMLTQLYSVGMRRVLDLGAEQDPAAFDERLLALCDDDELLNDLLVLHDLHPLDAAGRVDRALDAVRPFLGSHAGGVRLRDVRDGVAHLVLEGSCDGCPASSVTVRNAIEGAVKRAAPEVEQVVVDGEIPASTASGTGGSAQGLLQIGRAPAYTVEDCPV